MKNYLIGVFCIFTLAGYGFKVMGVFKDKYPDVNSRMGEEMEKESEREDSIAKADMVDINKKTKAKTLVTPTLMAKEVTHPRSRLVPKLCIDSKRYSGRQKNLRMDRQGR